MYLIENDKIFKTERVESVKLNELDHPIEQCDK